MQNMNELDLQDLLNEINKIPGDSLIERIISYCEENDLEPQDIGDSLGESEQFKRVLWIDAVDNNQIHDIKLKELLNSTEEIDDW